MESSRHRSLVGALAAAAACLACTVTGEGPAAPADPGQLQLGAATYTVAEGAGVVHLLVTRTGGASGVVTVRLATSDGAATSPSDYRALATTVVFADGDAGGKTIDVTLVDDAAFEPAEPFTVTLSAATGGAALGSPASATVSIQDDDAPVAGAGRLDDTGVTTCASADRNGLACGSAADGTAAFPRQDAEGGRDLTANDDRDGRAGFSFTKLDGAGTPLPHQAVAYDTTPWPCLLDRVTGLTWEVRTADGGLRDARWTYSWYRSDGLDDGGSPGAQNQGLCVDQAHCDTEKYRDAVNALALCGHADWRLPARDELLSLVDYGAPAAPLVDPAFLPDVMPLAAWSASVARGGRPWTVDFTAGGSLSERPASRRAVRLVRGGY